MKTIDEVLENYETYETWPEDRFGRRLCGFLNIEQMKKIGFELEEGFTHTPKEWTLENILIQLKEDAEFGLEKAINQRGISSSMMYDVCSAWCDIIDKNELILADEYVYGENTFRNILKYIENLNIENKGESL